MKKVIAITAVIVNEFNEILIYQRDDGNGQKIKYPNTWSLFGGTVEGDDKTPLETPLDCLVREMNEELELKLVPEECKEFHVYNHDSGEDHVFICRIRKDTPMELHEGRKKRWISFNELKTLPLAWCQEQILDEIEKVIF